jgi:hypothetical protein
MEISDKHHEAVRMMLLGMTNEEIARQIGLMPLQVSNIRRSPLVRNKLAELHTARDNKAINFADELQKDLRDSYEVLKAIQNGELADKEGNPVFVEAKLRADVAFGLVDRAGYSPVKKIQGEFIHGHLGSEEIDEIKRRARAANVITEVA